MDSSWRTVVGVARLESMRLFASLPVTGLPTGCGMEAFFVFYTSVYNSATRLTAVYIYEL
jgi:hypothetical protein